MKKLVLTLLAVMLLLVIPQQVNKASEEDPPRPIVGENTTI
ncbi:hypothetical protein [Paenisporosarcina indica]|nr:hypothetical protein [Paenisporosarcina indica]